MYQVASGGDPHAYNTTAGSEVLLPRPVLVEDRRACVLCSVEAENPFGLPLVVGHRTHRGGLPLWSLWCWGCSWTLYILEIESQGSGSWWLGLVREKRFHMRLCLCHHFLYREPAGNLNYLISLESGHVWFLGQGFWFCLEGRGFLWGGEGVV